ncbi:MAG TPA: hypothetical protein VFR98_05150 [Agromyces sp.]|jgi:hypothetical protein|nr:hypothetical protein [Agromyces sp.]
MQTTTTTRDVILDLLVEAADAHGVYEAAELGGVYDQGWPDWYATHMTAALEAKGYRLAPARDEH